MSRGVVSAAAAAATTNAAADGNNAATIIQFGIDRATDGWRRTAAAGASSSPFWRYRQRKFVQFRDLCAVLLWPQYFPHSFWAKMFVWNSEMAMEL